MESDVVVADPAAAAAVCYDTDPEYVIPDPTPMFRRGQGGAGRGRARARARAGTRDAFGGDDLGIYAHELGNSTEEEEEEEVGEAEISFVSASPKNFLPTTPISDAAAPVATSIPFAAEVTWNTSFPFWDGGSVADGSEVYGEI